MKLSFTCSNYLIVDSSLSGNSNQCWSNGFHARRQIRQIRLNAPGRRCTATINLVEHNSGRCYRSTDRFHQIWIESIELHSTDAQIDPCKRESQGVRGTHVQYCLMEHRTDSMNFVLWKMNDARIPKLHIFILTEMKKESHNIENESNKR